MRVLWLAAAVVLVDQATKAAVLRLMRRHESIPLVGDWLRLTFTENPGMAFGLTIGPPGTVTVLSIFATVLVAAYVYRIRSGYAPYRWSLGLILGGALGNIIDRVFYGVLLDYGPYFTGRVVDFVHVSLWQGFIPSPVPLIGGSYLELFPIWNVADMAIVLGVVGVLMFHRPFHEQRWGPEAAPSTDGQGEHPVAGPEERASGAEQDGPAASLGEDSEDASDVPASSVSESVSRDESR